ncbi:MAG: DEAD/DEAH box helicase [Opitutales bacterium]
MTDLTFEALPLAASIQEALADKGYTTPSPVQAQAIPILLEGRDLIACAQTGTGKTAAFALPILDRLAREKRKPTRGEIRCLVLTPTRELAVQVADSFRTYGRKQPLSIGLVHGGVSQRPQVRSLRDGLDVLVACPGRLLDLTNQGHVDFGGVSTFVLDEADRMLDMGFINDIRKIAAKIPTNRQTLLFSATMAPEIEKLARDLLRDPAEIRIAPQGTTAENIDQYIRFVDRNNKGALLHALLDQHRTDQPNGLSLVFSKTKHGARKLARDLNKAGFRADDIHGNKTQAARQKTLDRFRAGRTPVLVATDVASRGIDVKNITLVINYDLPMEPDAYVHRIGRTARAGESGRAVSFCSADDLNLLRGVQKLVSRDIPVDSDHEHHAAHIADRYARGGRGGSAGGKRQGGGRGRGPRSGGRSGGGFRSGKNSFQRGNRNRHNHKAGTR